MKKFKQLRKYGAVAFVTVAASPAMAAIDTTAAVTEIGDSKVAITAIGLAVLGVMALMFALRKSISLTGGR